MEEKIQSLKDLQKASKKGLASLYPDHAQIMVGMSSCGLGSGAKEVFWKILDEKVKYSLDTTAVYTGCLGYCQKEPLVDISLPGMPRVVYGEITPDKVAELISAVAAGKVKTEWALGRIDQIDHLDGSRHFYAKSGNGVNGVPLLYELPFYRKQMRIALRNCGFANHESIEEYIARGGYFALYKALHELQPLQVIEETKQSGLRGRVGAGLTNARQ